MKEEGEERKSKNIQKLKFDLQPASGRDPRRRDGSQTERSQRGTVPRDKEVYFPYGR